MPIKYTGPAQRDIRGIYATIKSDNPLAAKRWLKELRRKCREVLGQHPLVGEAREIWGCHVRQFTYGNYVIYFGSDPCEVLRVVHGARVQEDAWREGEGT